MYQTHHTHYSNSGNLLFHPLIVTLYGLVVNVSPQYMIHRVNVLLTLGLSVGFIYGGLTENTTDKSPNNLFQENSEPAYQTFTKETW